MTHPAITRAHLEATLVALAAVRQDLAPEIATRVDRDRLSVAAWALLEQLAYPTPDFGRQPGHIHTGTDAQVTLADRVEAITVGELFFWELDTLLAFVNKLPSRARARTSVMDVGAEAVA